MNGMVICIFFVFLINCECLGFGLPICELEKCKSRCEKINATGKCDLNQCKCVLGNTCSTMEEETCNYLCSKLNMSGSCDDMLEICNCYFKPKLCNISECQQSCKTDIRATMCKAMTAIGCIEYAGTKFCSCLCYV